MKKSILIIEDDYFFRKLIIKKLLSEGFNALEAINGEVGIELMKEKKPDLVLLDLLLPNIDGFEVLLKVKADQDISSIPVVILSNLGQKEDIERGLKSGAVEFLVKSQFDMDQIMDKVKNVLDKK